MISYFQREHGQWYFTIARAHHNRILAIQIALKYRPIEKINGKTSSVNSPTGVIVSFPDFSPILIKYITRIRLMLFSMGSKYLTTWFEVECLVRMEWCNKVLFLASKVHNFITYLWLHGLEKKRKWTAGPQIILVICIFLAVTSKWLCGILSWKKLILTFGFLCMVNK